MTTKSEKASPPACVYLLADHLDAILAAGEDLSKLGKAWSAIHADKNKDALTHTSELRSTLDELRTLELLMIARVLQARERASEVGQASEFFKPIANLFVSGTAYFRDIIEECGDSSVVDFSTADGMVSYLRSRGLVEKDAANLRDPSVLFASTDDLEKRFLVATRYPLGGIMDNAAAFLDALDLQFDLYAHDDDDEEILAVDMDPLADDTDRGLAFKSSSVLAGLKEREPRDSLSDRLSRLT